MGFFTKAKEAVLGAEIERKQKAAAEKIIKQKAMAAELKERERQSIRIAQERIKFKAEQRIKDIKNPKSYSSFGFGGYGTPFGMQTRPPINKPVAKPRYVYIKKGKRYIKKRVKSSVNKNINQPQIPQVQKRWDPIMGGWK